MLGVKKYITTALTALMAFLLLPSFCLPAFADEGDAYSNYFEKCTPGTYVKGQSNPSGLTVFSNSSAFDGLKESEIVEDADGKYLRFQGTGFFNNTSGCDVALSGDYAVLEYQVRVVLPPDHGMNYPDVLKLEVLNKVSGGNVTFSKSINIRKEEVNTTEWLTVSLLLGKADNSAKIFLNGTKRESDSVNVANIGKLFNGEHIQCLRFHQDYKSGLTGREVQIKSFRLYELAAPKAEISAGDNPQWVAVDQPVGVTFSAPVDRASVAAASVVMEDANGTQTACTVSDITDSGFTATPNSPLAYDTTYTLKANGITFSDFKLPVAVSGSFQTRLENPAPASVEVTGADRLVVPRAGEKDLTETYTAVVKNQAGNSSNISTEVTWSLAEPHDGVSIQPATGVLTVKPGAASGRVTVTAASVQEPTVTGQLPVYLDDVDVRPLARMAETVRGVYGQAAEAGTFEVERLSQLSAKLTAADALIAQEERTQAEIDSMTASLEQEARELIVSGFGKPEVTTLTLTGTAELGKGYEAEAVLQTPEGVEAQPAVYQWYTAAEPQAAFAPIEGANTASYVFEEKDLEQVLRVSVTPSYTVWGMSIPGEPKESQTVNAPSKPQARDVAVTGKAKAGETLSVSYSIYHRDGRPDNGSTVRWLKNNGAGFVPVANGKAYAVQDADVGSSICVEVTPVVTGNPSTGESVRSAAVSIGRGGSGGGAGGGGGGGRTTGGAVSGIGSLPGTVYNPTANTTPIAVEEQSMFADVTSHWAKQAVETLAAQGIMKGTADGLFEPDRDITRVEFAVLAARLFKDETAAYQAVFADVQETDWFADGVMLAAEKGIVGGADGKFDPNRPITREEMTKMVVETYRALRDEEPELDDNETLFGDDAEISGWARGYINFAYDMELIQGVDEVNFAPKATATRAQAAVIIGRLLTAVAVEEE